MITETTTLKGIIMKKLLLLSFALLLSGNFYAQETAAEKKATKAKTEKMAIAKEKAATTKKKAETAKDKTTKDKAAITKEKAETTK